MENIITIEERKQIFDNMAKLLDEYDYDYSDYALYKIIDTWVEQKADLIQLFKKHPNYVEGKFMIAFNSDWNRELDYRGIRNFVNWIRNNLDKIKSQLPNHVKAVIEKDYENSPYDNMGAYQENYPFGYYADFIYWDDSKMRSQFLDECTAEWFNNISPSMHFVKGQKMSRAINKICNWIGIDKLPDYNKEFAKFADAVNPLKIVRHTIISINPIDYLTMSFGNSWASCHTIDKENMRHMPNSYQGMYSSGTISYMLDKVSMVFYTVSADYNGNEYFFQDKINRCMFHYGEDKLIQGRVYPQDNDNNADNIYKDIREIVQKVIADCLGIPNYWTTKKGTQEIYPYVTSEGTHYRDYDNFNTCCISFSKEKGTNETEITIGHAPICISCGCPHDTEDNISCCASHITCEECGAELDEDEVIWIEGESYCRDCVSFCGRCGCADLNENMRWVESEDEYICEGCIDEYFERCESCGDYYRPYYMIELANGNYVCGDCRDEYYERCEACGEWYYRDNMFYNEDNEACYCSDCWEEVEENKEAE